jgi:N-acetylated-alpha-linked acidic dipeptidase
MAGSLSEIISKDWAMNYQTLILAICLTSMSGIAADNAATMLGFTAETATKQKALETQFDAVLSRDNLRDWMKRLTAHPHHLGSPADKENAEFIAAQFRSWGYDTRIEEFEVLFPTPRTRLLEMTGPIPFTASLREPPLKEDSTSGLTEEQLPVYNAYSKDGDVTGQLVYVNFGTPGDYELLTERGIDVAGKIVIARYGGCWRGIKPKVADEHGAVGCLIYSDPREDGYFQGDSYPAGAWRNENGAQRGSVCDLPLYPGDPLTPGIGATKDAKRLSRNEAPSLAKIPVLPISYADATPLLRNLQGSLAPEAWRGALPITYHLGPGPATVHLKLEFDWKQTPLYDVIAQRSGSERPDEWIIRGNHHDAWVCGAEDPVSGTVALMEEARAVAKLAQGGWTPKRTIVYAIWDGEEPGLLGSTEWVETHAEELRQKAAVYVNSDGNDRGFLNMEGSHTLERFMNEIARAVPDPESKQTVAERLRAQRLLKASLADRREIRDRADLRMSALGSGSDYTPFLQHLGVASLNLGYGGEEGGGVYHSIYDSFDHYTRFGDPGFEYGLLMVRTCGRVSLRLADADMLPYEFSDFAETVGKYIKEVSKLTEELREGTIETNRLIADKALIAAADPTQTFVAPQTKPEVPFLNFAPLDNALATLQRSVDRFERSRKDSVNGGLPASVKDQMTLDQALLQLERSLTRAEGLPRRPWYQHLIYAPGFYTGYGVKTLPGVREAIEQRNWGEATEQIIIVAVSIEKYADRLDHCTAMLNRSSQ